MCTWKKSTPQWESTTNSEYINHYKLNGRYNTHFKTYVIDKGGTKKIFTLTYYNSHISTQILNLETTIHTISILYLEADKARSDTTVVHGKV